MGTATLFSPSAATAPVAETRTTGRLRTFVREWVERMQQRQQLAAMNTYELRDIGLTRSDAMLEINKAPWQR
ncbi:MAG: DUF1127 domain-containing protein [Alphaproteobacteria bacterium]|nr:DUF1127 domain-containing protein [Alphaproteobacteria bacterium]MCB9929505.1 DUF1127 domain-containing protein [Alphaproteobacteria bacterium]